jgi:hypothetical protein
MEHRKSFHNHQPHQLSLTVCETSTECLVRREATVKFTFRPNARYVSHHRHLHREQHLVDVTIFIETPAGYIAQFVNDHMQVSVSVPQTNRPHIVGDRDVVFEVHQRNIRSEFRRFVVGMDDNFGHSAVLLLTGPFAKVELAQVDEKVRVGECVGGFAVDTMGGGDKSAS